MSLLKKISEAKFHETTKSGSVEISQAEKISETEKLAAGNFSAAEIFPCGHQVASFAWICSATRRARCAVCDPRAPGVTDPGRLPSGVAEFVEGAGGASGDAGDESADTESSEINPGERQGTAYAFFDTETPNGAYHVATRFPGLWGRSGGASSNLGKTPVNVTAGVMLGWSGEREGPSLGHARFASIQDWQRSLGIDLDEHGRFDPPAEILAGRKNSV